MNPEKFFCVRCTPLTSAGPGKKAANDPKACVAEVTATADPDSHSVEIADADKLLSPGACAGFKKFVFTPENSPSKTGKPVSEENWPCMYCGCRRQVR